MKFKEIKDKAAKVGSKVGARAADLDPKLVKEIWKAFLIGAGAVAAAGAVGFAIGTLGDRLSGTDPGGGAAGGAAALIRPPGQAADHRTLDERLRALEHGYSLLAEENARLAAEIRRHARGPHAAAETAEDGAARSETPGDTQRR